MTGGQASLGNQLLNVRRQLQQADQVGYCGPILPSPAANLVVTQLQLPAQAVECLRCFNRVQILALDVFDECNFEQPFIGYLLNHHWNSTDSGNSGSAPPAFAGHQLIPLAVAAYNQWLDNAISTDRLR